MTPEDFSAFYEQVHGTRPFPWQRDLVSQIVEQREWPSLVDVPTGLGKTSMLDIAVFLSALDVDKSFDHRIGRRRIFFVVDRRIVVDQAAEHAQRLVTALRDAQETAPMSVAGRVARRMCEGQPNGASGGLPRVVRMRGGATWDAAWLERPDMRGIITGTVDQVGSRLFFRGYGVSARRWPIDAALVGNDSLILVDEAHLATALTTTLDAARSYDKPSDNIGLPRPVIVQLTATPPSVHSGWMPTFDEQAHLADPEAARRLEAPKSLRLRQVKKNETAKALAEAAAAEATQPGARVLVVCNTIDQARDVHSRLRKTLPKTLLLIGRSRSCDREAVVDQVIGLFGAGRAESDESVALVATQTVEVGIDLDATALVTECASWDALVQRLGRVNRLGRWGACPVVVINDDDSKPPVYGGARVAAAAYLLKKLGGAETMDASPLALRRLGPPPPDALQDRPVVPLLLPPHLDAWTRTGPAPANDAPLDAYLHGIDGGAPVTVAWRDGLLAADGSLIGPSEATAVIDAIPIRAEETVDVPLSALRRWLGHLKPQPISDWDEDWVGPFTDESGDLVWRRTILAEGTAHWETALPRELRPGDTVVVPAERGGLDEYGWYPDQERATKVRDVAELIALQHNRPVMRLDKGLPDRLGLLPPDPDLWDALSRWQAEEDPDERDDLAEQCEDRVRSWLEAQPADPVASVNNPWRRLVDGTRQTRWDLLRDSMATARVMAVKLPGESSTVSELRLPIVLMRAATKRAASQDLSDDAPDGTTHLGAAVTLSRHGDAVATRAEEIAAGLGLAAELRQVVVDAARWHDLGKIDARFQAMLFDGDDIRAALADEPLAKSGMPPGDTTRFRNAFRKSGLPSGARHEAWSHEILATYLGQLTETYPGDADLLLHLVASHHGHARPLLPPVVERGTHRLEVAIGATTVEVAVPRTVDLNLADRFQTLNRRYGRWGLALLESIIRCADMTVSGEGS